MDNIRSLFKHTIAFPDVSEYGITPDSGTAGIVIMNELYKTDVIHNPERYGITDYHDIKRKIKLFLFYLMSKYKDKLRIYDFNMNTIDIEVGVFFSSSNRYTILDKFCVCHFKCEQDLNIKKTTN